MELKRESQQMVAIRDVDESFRKQVNHVFDEWYANQMDFEQALQALEAFRQDASIDQNPVNEGWIDHSLGIIYGSRSKFEDSIVHFNKAKECFESYQVWRQVASCNLNLGESYRQMGNFARAQKHFHQAYTLAGNLKDVALQAFAITNEGMILLNLQSYERAKEIFEKALKLIREQWQPEGTRGIANRIDSLCEIHYALAKIYLHENNLNRAWEEAKRCLQYGEENGRPLRIGHAWRALGTVMNKLKQSPDEAMSSDPDFYYQASLDAFQSVNAESEWAKTLFAQGKALLERGKKQAASQNFQQAAQVFNKLAMWQDAAQVTEAQLALLEAKTL